MHKINPTQLYGLYYGIWIPNEKWNGSYRLSLFWFVAPVSQDWPALNCSKIARHENEWFDSFVFAFLWFILESAPFLLHANLYIYLKAKIQKVCYYLAYNSLTTELQKLLFLHLFDCQQSAVPSIKLFSGPLKIFCIEVDMITVLERTIFKIIIGNLSSNGNSLSGLTLSKGFLWFQRSGVSLECMINNFMYI